MKAPRVKPECTNPYIAYCPRCRHNADFPHKPTLHYCWSCDARYCPICDGHACPHDLARPDIDEHYDALAERFDAESGVLA